MLSSCIYSITHRHQASLCSHTSLKPIRTGRLSEAVFVLFFPGSEITKLLFLHAANFIYKCNVQRFHVSEKCSYRAECLYSNET